MKHQSLNDIVILVTVSILLSSAFFMERSNKKSREKKIFSQGFYEGSNWMIDTMQSIMDETVENKNSISHIRIIQMDTVKYELFLADPSNFERNRKKP